MAATVDDEQPVSVRMARVLNVVLWIVAGLLGAAFLAAGAMKLTRSREKLAASGMGWTQDFSAGTIKLIGAIAVHGRRKENQAIGINVVLLLLAAVVVWGRFGPYSF
jgi:hypothetical protein